MISSQPCKLCGYLSCTCNGMGLPPEVTGKTSDRYDTGLKFAAIVMHNWTTDEITEARNRETWAAIDHEAYVLWLTDAAS